jgi:hypothetical protein
MPEGNKICDGPPARPDDAVDAQWLFPQERAPSPPRNKSCKYNGFGDPALLSSNGSQPTPSPPFSFDVNTTTTMDELRATISATLKEIAALNAATAKEIAALVAAIAKDNVAHAKARCKPFVAVHAMATSPPIAAHATAFSHPTVAVLKENNIPPSHGTRDGHGHATGGMVPAVNSPGPSGVTSTAVSFLPARVITSWPGILSSIQIPSNVNRYLINHLISTMLSGQCFVFLFCQLTEQPHQGNDMNNPTSTSRRQPNMFLIHKN